MIAVPARKAVAGVRYEVPALACDCHMHVFGPPERFPGDANRSYTPVEAPLADWRRLADGLGLDRLVVVQPSAYGADNACTAEMLAAAGPSAARGIGAMGAGTPNAVLRSLDAAGMRGIRLKPKSAGSNDPAGLGALILQTADRIGWLGWHVQLYAELAQVAAAATAFVVGSYSFYVARFLLGVAEAGFFPGVTYLLAAWFPAQYRTRVLAWFLVAVPLSSVMGGPFSVLLLEMDGMAGLRGWQWMFLIQGLPACIIGFFVLSMVRDDPQDANWLTPAERDTLLGVLAAEHRDRPARSFSAALRDGRVWLLAAIQFGFIIGSYGVGIWLPLILKGQGLTNLAIGFVSAIPYVFATVGMLAWAWYVGRSGAKIVNLALACFLAAIGLIGSVMAGSFLPSLIGLTLALVGVTSARALFWTIPARFLTGASTA